MHVKAALLLLLTFTSIATATATIIVPTMSSRPVFPMFKGTKTIGDSPVKIMGDPIDDDPAFVH